MVRELLNRAGGEMAGIGAERAGWAMIASTDLGGIAPSRTPGALPGWSMYDEDEEDEGDSDAFADDESEDDEDFIDDDEDFIEDDEETVEDGEEFDDDDDDEL